METSEVLNRAADLIEERGWRTGGGWHDKDGPLCMEGALMAAAGLRRNKPAEFTTFYTSCPAYDAVTAYLERSPRPRLGPTIDALWQWNDDLPKETGATRVIAALRAAAVIEAAREQDAAWATRAERVTS